MQKELELGGTMLSNGGSSGVSQTVQQPQGKVPGGTSSVGGQHLTDFWVQPFQYFRNNFLELRLSLFERDFCFVDRH